MGAGLSLDYDSERNNDTKECDWFNDKRVLESVGASEIECIKSLRADVDTPFCPDEIESHQRLLADIWTAFTGDRATFKLKSSRWKEFGFQCEDPQTDVRGGGKLAMENLKYFLTHYPDSAMSLMKRQNNIMKLKWRENWYPFSTVGVNVTDLVCRILGVYRRKFNGISNDSNAKLRDFLPWSLWPSLLSEEDVRTKNKYQAPGAPAPPKWQKGFSEIYCVAFMLLDRNFLEHNASYFDFNHVLRMTEEELTIALHKNLGNSLQRIKPRLSIYPRAIRPPPPRGPAPTGASTKFYAHAKRFEIGRFEICKSPVQAKQELLNGRGSTRVTYKKKSALNGGKKERIEATKDPSVTEKTVKCFDDSKEIDDFVYLAEEPILS
mmetsp:Transcript_9582/g.13387  ORF Transcript_9582/g.13387 Transcript_9582/m.13387 type:complete len:379 (+) Transcript_9582:5-1141(+)|eukprot:CAMPEP_0184489332 /NCGR_PEP_ID=MMETSP0113_2-20130426/15087_1 /TAXON_ID=91329 /ORGANISM="Norrisiella sphaerica, Strain BC52" /LENGTH=378 /DNA_ID=CAMNT_0026872683 /DNA_START=5 /DNA_END=1141 /DNA_ORIENTATION=-